MSMFLGFSVLLQPFKGYGAQKVSPRNALMKFEGRQAVICHVAVLLKLEQAEGSVGETSTCISRVPYLINTGKVSGELASCKDEVTLSCTFQSILLVEQALGGIARHSLHIELCQILNRSLEL